MISPMIVNWSQLVRQNVQRMQAERGLSQAELARKADVPQPTVSRFLATETRTATVDLVGSLAKALGVHPCQLLRPEAAAEPSMATPEEGQLVATYRALPAHEQDRVRHFAEGLVASAPGAIPPAPVVPSDEQRLLDGWKVLTLEQRGRLMGYLDRLREDGRG